MSHTKLLFEYVLKLFKELFSNLGQSCRSTDHQSNFFSANIPNFVERFSEESLTFLIDVFDEIFDHLCVNGWNGHEQIYSVI